MNLKNQKIMNLKQEKEIIELKLKEKRKSYIKKI